MKEKIKKTLKTIVQFILNPRLLICVLLAWIITNGWSYIMIAIGTYFGIEWMIAVSGTYLAFLWFPFSPEKIVTAAIAIWLLRLLFPKDERTLAVLRRMLEKAKRAIRIRREKRKSKKAAKAAEAAEADDCDDGESESE